MDISDETIERFKKIIGDKWLGRALGAAFIALGVGVLTGQITFTADQLKEGLAFLLMFKAVILKLLNMALHAEPPAKPELVKAPAVDPEAPTPPRGEWPKKIAGLLLAIGLLGLAGCSTEGYVKVENIEDLVEPVCDRHDAYVIADPTLEPEKRASELRSTEILRRVLREAKAHPADAPPK